MSVADGWTDEAYKVTYDIRDCPLSDGEGRQDNSSMTDTNECSSFKCMSLT